MSELRWTEGEPTVPGWYFIKRSFHSLPYHITCEKVSFHKLDKEDITRPYYWYHLGARTNREGPGKVVAHARLPIDFYSLFDEE